MIKASEARQLAAERKEQRDKANALLLEKINKIIVDAINADEEEAICHFEIPEDVQNILVENGYHVTHFIEGYGYDGYLIAWDVPFGGKYEYTGKRFQTKGE